MGGNEGYREDVPPRSLGRGSSTGLINSSQRAQGWRFRWNTTGSREEFGRPMGISRCTPGHDRQAAEEAGGGSTADGRLKVVVE
jgi:hypothetical protein